jgi:hypothetical protein
MEQELVYRGRRVTQEEIAFIRELILTNQKMSRQSISREVCRAWGWRQPNGILKDIVCRGLLLKLHRDGHITLPAPKSRPKNTFNRKPKGPVEVDRTLIEFPLDEIGPIELHRVRRTPLERIHDGLIAQYHYLGYTQPVGEHLKYIALANGRPLACLVWSSAPYHIGCRDRFIGWSKEIRKKNLSLIVNNTRFLILPWVRVRYLASHLLGLASRIVPQDWQDFYKHPIVFFETFVDTERFKGTCYKAANWIHLGQTTGRGKNDKTHKPNRSLKAVFGYPLSKDFREVLCHG